MNFKEPALKLQDRLVSFRRDFHSDPELSFEEVKTNGKIRKFLTENGIEIQEINSGYSVVGIIRGAKPGKTFGIRADIDALPMPEMNDVPYKSKNEGVMHACGHDGHTASLMGVALLLNEVKDQMSGNVKLFFQAAEEKIPGGAKAMVEAGCLENPHVDAVMGYHVNTGVECGKIGFGAGPDAAACDTFKLTVTGHGGHGAYPQRTVDPILIAGNFLTTVQSVVSRSIDPTKGAVITIGSIHGGSKENIIADEVVMLGTIRSLDKDVRTLLHDRIREICKGLETTFRCKMDYDVEMGYPVLINDGDFIEEYARPSVAKVLGEDCLYRVPGPGMGGEDFAYFLEKCPGVMGALGAGNAAKGLTVGGHNSKFDIDEDCLWRGAATLAQTAFDYLEKNK
ncbi:MAG: M20 family metallopeptidase [Oscillospiraceae bacterium]